MSDTANTPIMVCSKKKLGNMQAKAGTVLAGRENGSITKILSVSVNAFAESAECGKAEVKANIALNIDAVVVYDDGTVGSAMGTNTARVNLENAKVTEGLAVNVMPCVLDVTSSLNSGEATVSVIISADIFAINKNVEVKSIAAGEDVFTRESDIEVNTHKTGINHTGRVNLEEKADPKFKSLILSSHTACIKNIVCNNDYITVGGEIFVNTVYECTDGQIKSFIKATSFNEEIEALGVTAGSIAQAKIFTGKPLTVNAVMGGENAVTLQYELPFSLTADVFDKTNRECIVDAYHLIKEVNLTTESFEQSEMFVTRSSEESIIANYTVAETQPRIEKILSVTGGNVSLVNSFVKNAEVALEGIANINIIYFSEDEEGNNVLNSMVVDLPYSLTFACPDAMEGDNVDAQIILGEISVKNRRGRELEIIAGVKVSYSLDRPVISAVATQITFGEDKPQKDYALEIYVARENQTLWDIAKYLNISTEDLLTQNAELTLPVNAGDKIVCYKKREIKF